jgi:SAM-dependent methyltransferase
MCPTLRRPDSFSHSGDGAVKWLIPPVGRSVLDARDYWDFRHGRLQYENVYSVTEDPGLRAVVVDMLQTVVRPGAAAKVLVPGCGSRALLERDLVESFPAMSVVATDYPGVIDAAAARLCHPRVEFIGRDTRCLDRPAEFDAAVVINSVLSDCDHENRLMLQAIHAALKPNGVLVGLFPTVFAHADIGLCEERERWRLELVDLLHSRYCFDERTSDTHILYTPLRLRLVLRETGFAAARMEIFFCESACLRDEASRVYGLDGDDVALYELLVTARKAPCSRPGR